MTLAPEGSFAQYSDRHSERSQESHVNSSAL